MNPPHYMASTLLSSPIRTQEYELVPFGKGGDGPVILITNSKVSHSLSGSEYPVRVQQCGAAVKAIQSRFPEVLSLRDATLEMLEAVRGEMEEVIFRRARHCVTENVRTLSTVEALRAGDFEAVGKCMTQSHSSLKDDYEVRADNSALTLSFNKQWLMILLLLRWCVGVEVR